MNNDLRAEIFSYHADIEEGQSCDFVMSDGEMPCNCGLMEAIAKHDKALVEAIFNDLTDNLRHDEFCKNRGPQFKECALCYIDRIKSKYLPKEGE